MKNKNFFVRNVENKFFYHNVHKLFSNLLIFNLSLSMEVRQINK